MEEIRRQRDGELCGHVDERGGQWYALTMFGAVLGRHDRRAGAADQVLTEGLASLAERWTLRRGDSGQEEVVCIQEANAAAVTVPGVLLAARRADPYDHGREITSGDWEMYR